jgi:hypothetical protein
MSITVAAMCIAKAPQRREGVNNSRRREPQRREQVGTSDATCALMKSSKQKKMAAVLKGVMAAMPAIPYIMRPRRRASTLAYVLSGIGVAVAGGLVALLLLSPRTRHRALDAAKGTYGKVNEKISHLRPRHRHEERKEEAPLSDGLAGSEYSAPTTGV